MFQRRVDVFFLDFTHFHNEFGVFQKRGGSVGAGWGAK